MKNILVLFFFLALFLSCQPKSEMEGNWVLAYTQFVSERDTFYSNECRFLSIKGNRFKYLEYIQPGYQIETVKSSGKFLKNGDKLVFNEYINHSLELTVINSDSLVFGNREEIQVYKKLPLKYQTPEWDPTHKHYEFIGNKGRAYFDFINDSLMLEYSKSSEMFTPKKWWLQEFEGYQFLVLNQIDEPQPILIDSVDGELVFLSTYDTNINNYLLKEYPKNDITEKLRGNWKLLKIGLPPPPLESLMFEFEKFKLTKDSIFTGSAGTSFKEKWILTADGKNILFPSKKWKYWKIVQIKQDTLILDMPEVFALGESPGLPNRLRRIRTYVKD